MIQSRKVIGAHALFFLSGAAFTLPAPGTASRTAKPAATDTGWFDFGVSDWDIGNTGKTVDLMAPAPGARQLYDKITTSKGIQLKGNVMEMSNLVWQLLLSSGALPASPTAGGLYNPLAGEPVIRGWLKLQQYDQGDVLLNTMDVFVAMTLPGDVKFAEAPVDFAVVCDSLYSTLNVGTLA